MTSEFNIKSSIIIDDDSGPRINDAWADSTARGVAYSIWCAMGHIVRYEADSFDELGRRSELAKCFVDAYSINRRIKKTTAKHIECILRRMLWNGSPRPFAP